MMEQTLLELEIDTEKMPLGKLTKRHIQQVQYFHHIILLFHNLFLPLFIYFFPHLLFTKYVTLLPLPPPVRRSHCVLRASTH
jgi:hypothetical protein